MGAGGMAYKACLGAATDRTTTGSLRSERFAHAASPRQADRFLFKDKALEETDDFLPANRRKAFYEKSKLLSDFNAESGVQSPGQK